MTGFPLRRRSFLLLAAAATTSCATACATASYGGPQRTLTIAAGEKGGFYKEFAALLAQRLTTAPGDLNATVRESTGSVANLELLSAGEVDLALTLADTADSAVAGAAPFTAPVPLRAIGRVYENYLQLVVPTTSPVRSVADLAGRRISLGAEGSGAALSGERLLAVSKVRADVDHLPLTEAADLLAAGDIDALLWSGGVPTPGLAELDARRPIRLVDITAHVTALRATYDFAYQQVGVPDSGYGHPGAVTTIGVPNLLVAAPSLPEDVAEEVARLLVEDAPDLVPEQALGTQYLDRRSLIATDPVPLHPGAARAYRQLRG
ncbi:C4-dicarboxylate ABC transporter substrate-binding protein [Actinophytocola xinjiangensis]|uniref:C4-dicarboxylate ABC transporter substrate-binding protein n=1 Tax=Actinophytocola xinjiangensis TaxID=485602 RepID=A0A7Z0WQ50_9PSEU|nr:TAXI family TRAP transporter solute-binding subunit [Actinophytocola xinjiangensis]OLF12059.1 C4-dicarboxylate ABC transporter substrate-binding protein [Actinophytocola xinjiangensis]